MQQNLKFRPVWLDKIFKNDIINTKQFCFINFQFFTDDDDDQGEKEILFRLKKYVNFGKCQILPKVNIVVMIISASVLI